MLLAEIIDAGGVLDELVGPGQSIHRRLDARFAEALEHGAAVAAHGHMVFESGHDVGRGTKEPMHLGIEGLEVAGVDDRHIEPIGAQFLGGLTGEREHGPESEQGHLHRTGFVLELRVDLGLADLDHRGLVLDGHPFGVAARVTNRDRMRLQRGGEHHVLKFILVGRSHADDQR